MDASDKKRAILLSVCGARTYQLIRSLVAPRKPADLEFSKPSVIVQRYQFHSRVRQPGESVSTFVAELRRLSQNCEFAESMEDMLRDKLVCGIGDIRIQRRLLSEATLKFPKALELTQAMESAARNSRDLEKATASQQPGTVHAIHQPALKADSGYAYNS